LKLDLFMNLKKITVWSAKCYVKLCCPEKQDFKKGLIFVIQNVVFLMELHLTQCDDLFENTFPLCGLLNLN